MADPLSGYGDGVEMVRRMCHDDLSEFIKESWRIVEPNDPFTPGWHIDAISEHLEAVYHGQIRELLINIPPRHMKSLQVCVFFPAWVWQRDAGKAFIYATHAKSLAVRDSVKCRDLIESPWYQKLFNIDWRMKDDQNAKDRFENTRTGIRIAASVGSSIIGEGADFFCIDDPHDPMGVMSDTQREEVITWHDAVVPTRVKDPKTSAKITVMQRLHEKDLAGHILAQGNVVHLCLPAEYEGNKKTTWRGWTEPREVVGELLWPARFGETEVSALKVKLGSQRTAGQLQQRPAPADGNIVKREWWKYWRTMPKQFDKIIMSWDLTFEDGKKNDFVCGGIIGKLGPDKYILDMVLARMGFNQQLASFEQMCMKWPQCNAKLVEKAANGAALHQVLMKKISGIILIKPLGSKTNRAEAIAPEIEAGNWFLPDPIAYPWSQGIVEQWAVFPNGANDDIIDMMSQGGIYLSNKATNFAPLSMTGVSKWIR